MSVSVMAKPEENCVMKRNVSQYSEGENIENEEEAIFILIRRNIYWKSQ